MNTPVFLELIKLVEKISNAMLDEQRVYSIIQHQKYWILLGHYNYLWHENVRFCHFARYVVVDVIT